jgi:hypothetical protein
LDHITNEDTNETNNLYTEEVNRTRFKVRQKSFLINCENIKEMHISYYMRTGKDIVEEFKQKEN